jgi:hypothetical protein
MMKRDNIKLRHSVSYTVTVLIAVFVKSSYKDGKKGHDDSDDEEDDEAASADLEREINLLNKNQSLTSGREAIISSTSLNRVCVFTGFSLSR